MSYKNKITIGSAVYIRGRASDTFQVIEEYEIPGKILEETKFSREQFFPHYICRCVVTGEKIMAPLMHLSTISLFSTTEGNEEFSGSRTQLCLDID